MEQWAIFAWVGTTVIAIGGTWITALLTYKGKAGETAANQWIELVKAVQSENRRYSEKQAQLEARIESLEEEVNKWARDFKQLDNQNSVLAHTLASVEADKEEQARRHRAEAEQLRSELAAEREINGSFQRTVDEQRLLTEHYARTNRRLAKLLTEKFGMNPEDIELHIREQIELN